MASRRLRAPGAGFKRLPPGQHGLAREAVRRSQRERLQRAMIASVAEHGYAKTKIRDLARIAAVSPNAFYQLYRSKEDCFLDTHDVIGRIETERVAAAAAGPGDWSERLRAAIAALMEAVIGEPRAAYLAVVEIFAVSASALEHQQRALDAHEKLMRELLDDAPHGRSVSDTTVKAIVAGVRTLVYHHVNAGHPPQLRELVDPVHRWALTYHTPLPVALPDPLGGAGGEPMRLPAGGGESVGAGERVLGHRERIMRAVAALSCERGYASLTMPAITARAGVSNQTFYEHFKNKHEAFMACYDRVSRRAIGATLHSFQAAPDWPRAIRASLRTLLGIVAAEPQFARLALFEVLAAGRSARRSAEARMEAYSAVLDPGFHLRADGPPRVVGALIAGGVWGVVQSHVLHGRARRLPELTPQLTYLALAPFVGAEHAARVALEEPARS